jgi:hypothetical protein
MQKYYKNKCIRNVHTINLFQTPYTTLCDKVCRWFSPGPRVSSSNKTDCHDITEKLLKVGLNTVKQTTTPHMG